MYQYIGDINSTKVGGLESLLDYMKENFFSKDEPAINEHHYHITKKQYNEEKHNIYHIDKSNTFNIKNNRSLTEQYCNKKQHVNNSTTNNITKKNTIHNTENITNAKMNCSYETYASNNYKSQIAYLENNLYNRPDNIKFNNTNNI